jgi:hypothetical protein
MDKGCLMGCEKYREHLGLISPLEEDNALLKEAADHINTCSGCREEYLEHKEFDSLLRDQMGAVDPPAFLAHRILNQIRYPDRKFKPGWGLSYAFGGIIICLLVLISYNQNKIISEIDRLGSTRSLEAPENLSANYYALLDILAANAAKRHQSILSSRFVVFDDNLTNNSFRQKFSFKIALPEFSPNLKLVGGSKCHSCCYEMAYLLYRNNSESISLCMFSAAEFGLTNWDGKPTLFRKDNYNVSLWKKDNLTYAMVSQIPEDEAKSIIWDFQK